MAEDFVVLVLDLAVLGVVPSEAVELEDAKVLALSLRDLKDLLREMAKDDEEVEKNLSEYMQIHAKPLLVHIVLCHRRGESVDP